MSKIVIKRDGSKEKFNIIKIKNALSKAHDFSTEDLDTLISKVESKVLSHKDDEIDIKDIQNFIENILMGSKFKDVARTLIEYRHQRDMIREKKGKLFTDIQEFLNQSNKELTNENANKDAKVVSTHRDLLAGILSKHIATNQMLPEHLAKWHKDGYGHIHDLDYYISPLLNCCLINYPDMMENGFQIGNAHIGKPKSIGVASTVLSQIVLAVASSQYGK